MSEDIETIIEVENVETVKEEEAAVEDAPLEESAPEEGAEETVTLSVVHASFAYALTEMPVEASVECPDSLLGAPGAIRILDEHGKEVARTDVVCSEAHIEAQIAMIAPDEPGEHVFHAVLELGEDCDIDCAATFSFEVREHRVVLSTWGVPMPVNSGDTFTLNVGARCLGDCCMVDAEIIVNDEQGERKVSFALGDQVKEDTTGTYCSSMEITAPDDEALHTWTVICLLPESEASHKVEAVDLVFRTVARPEHTVIVHVVNADDQLPIKSANVMVGPRRAFTDENGTARVKVSNGVQMLRVSKPDYRSVEEEIVIDGDADLAVELVYDPTL